MSRRHFGGFLRFFRIAAFRLDRLASLCDLPGVAALVLGIRRCGWVGLPGPMVLAGLALAWPGCSPSLGDCDFEPTRLLRAYVAKEIWTGTISTTGACSNLHCDVCDVSGGVCCEGEMLGVLGSTCLVRLERDDGAYIEKEAVFSAGRCDHPIETFVEFHASNRFTPLDAGIP